MREASSNHEALRRTHHRENTHLGRVIFVFLFLLLCQAACGFLVPSPGIKPVPPALEVQSLNLWAAGKFWEGSLSCLTREVRFHPSVHPPRIVRSFWFPTLFRGASAEGMKDKIKQESEGDSHPQKLRNRMYALPRGLPSSTGGPASPLHVLISDPRIEPGCSHLGGK